MLETNTQNPYAPKTIMGCLPFLQKLKLVPVRPRQIMTLDTEHLRSQFTPAEYPNPPVINKSPLHGKTEGAIYPIKEVEKNSN
jgi:hypothetical protein